MYGLPKQNSEIWKNSVLEFIKLAHTFPQITHVSAYGLELNNSGPLAKLFPVASGVYPTDEEFVGQLTYLINKLAESGFGQYEISNFAKPGYQSKHNLNYWQEGEYHAFGVSAHRYIKPYRSSNWRSLGRYLEDCLGDETYELIDEKTRIKEAIMLGLRMTAGISLKQFKQTFAIDLTEKYKSIIESLVAQNMIICQEDNLRLTSLGQPLANLVISEFF